MQTEQTVEQPVNPLDYLKEEISGLLQRNVDGETQFDKNWQYPRLRKADLYLRGLQYTAPVLGPGGSMDYVPASLSMLGQTTGIEDYQGVLDYNVDIVRSYCRKYVGSMGMRAFYNLKAVPDNASSQADRAAAKQAEKAYLWLRNVWNMRLRNLELFYYHYKAGTRYIYHPYVPNAELFGTREEEVLTGMEVPLPGTGGWKCQTCGALSSEPAQVTDPTTGAPAMACPKCGAPLQEFDQVQPDTTTTPQRGAPKTYANSGPIFKLLTAYEVTHAFDAKELGDSPFWHYEYEEHPGVLLQMFGAGLRKQMDPDNTTNSGETIQQQQGQLSRGVAASIVGMSRPSERNRWTFARTWIKTLMYEMVHDDKKRQYLYEKFPSGLKISRVNGKTVALEDEDFREVWTAIKGEPSDYLYNDPFCWGILGQQDLTNDWWNIVVAYAERKLPTTIIDADLLDLNAIRKRGSLPTEAVSAKAAYGRSIQDGIGTISTPQGEMNQYLGIQEKLETTVQQNLGITPPVFGGNEKDPTAEGARLRSQAALQQNAPMGEYVAQGWAECVSKAVKLIAKYGTGAIQVSQSGASADLLDIDVLRGGKYRFEAEQGIPASEAERADRLETIITQNPEVAAGLGLDKPSSAPGVRRYLLPGMDEIRIPDEDLANRVEEIIHRLLTQAPIPGPAGDVLPSIAPEDFVDDNAKMADLVRGWLNSPSGIKASDENKQGYLNVVAYGKAQFMRANPPPIPLPGQAQPPGGPPPQSEAPNGAPQPQG